MPPVKGRLGSLSLIQRSARKKKRADGRLALSYNAQVSADAAPGLIDGVEARQAVSDWDEELATVERIELRMRETAQQIVADAGYRSGAVIESMAERRMVFWAVCHG
jgi:hypothetical protein